MIYERLASRCSSPDAAARIEAALREPRWDRGAASIPDFHAKLRRDLGYTGSWETFCDDWCCHFTPDADMLAFVAALSGHHRIVLFSNTNKEHWDYLLARTDLGHYERYLSYEMGLSKPSIESFAFVAAEAGLTPARTLFFDDRADNVEGARRAGFRAEVFRGRAWLARTLVEEGMKVPA